VPVATDGSQAAIVPARRAMSWQLIDTNGVGVVRERYWLTFASGEIRTCTSCHGINEETQANGPVPTNTPLALITLLNYWKTNTMVLPNVAVTQNTNFFQITFSHRPTERG
jgi:hydrazine synthase alpha subunit-like protein